MVDHFVKTCEFDQVEVVSTCAGSELAGNICQHPFIERKSPILEAEYVTMESGTGCVHIAPGHGLDDYLTGLSTTLRFTARWMITAAMLRTNTCQMNSLDYLS